MKIRALPLGWCLVVLVGSLTGCSSAPREARKPSAAIVISMVGARPSPAEVADIHKLMQPEIEKRGYMMAKNSRTADYFVHVRYPFDPLDSQAIFEKAEPTVPFLRSHETGRERSEREYKTAIANMVRDPK